MVPGRPHRRVENTEDFKGDWNWGDPPDELESKILDQLKEQASEIAREVHEQSCILGAQTAFDELGKNGFFLMEGITDNGLLIVFQGTDGFCIYDELRIVDETIDVEDLQHYPAHLRRLADAIEARCQQEQSPSKPSA